MPNIEEFLKFISIYPKNMDVYELALTHPSCNVDAKTAHHDYERLEYIGDAVLGYVTADIIYKIHKDMNPGNMSKLRSNIVRSSSLANYARSINLMNYIKTGQSMNAVKISQSNKILEDVFEALVGAIYLDKGINVAYKFVKKFINKDIKNAKVEDLTDAKTRLQEELQASGQAIPTYNVVSQTGPAHDRTFEVSCEFDGVVMAKGIGKSKKEAEENAAKEALKKRTI